MSELQAEDRLTKAALWLRSAADKCCQCTDGHHEQQFTYGTDSNVRMSRDTARALALWFDAAGADLWAHGPLCCERGCLNCDDALWMPHVRRALVVAQGILTRHRRHGCRPVTRRRDRAVLHDPTADAPSQHVSPADRRRAAVTTAEAALAGGWEHDLPGVLAMLGLEAGR